jgi:predicted DNA-binding transcriptional regulator AlpA
MADSKFPPLLSPDELLRVIPMSRRAIERAVDLGTFPSPIALPGSGPNGSRRVAWRGEDIQTWLDALAPTRGESQGSNSHV